MQYSTVLSILSILPSALSAPSLVARECTGPDVNDGTVALVKEFEGFVASPEPDPIGLPTVGYGHLCTSEGCAEVSYDFPLTEETAVKLLHDDLKSPQQTITLKTGSGVTLNENEYGALVSWAFNVGGGNVGSSSLLERLNAGEAPSAVLPEELPKWNKAGGEVLEGLVRRRAAEVELSKKGGDGAIPAC